MAYFQIKKADGTYKDFSAFVQNMKVSYELLLSENSGRNAAGTMIIEKVGAPKMKLEVIFKPMTQTEMLDLLSTISNYVVTIQFLNPKVTTASHLDAMECYISTPAPDFYKIVGADILYKPLAVNFILL